jgi:hypothetical protein
MLCTVEAHTGGIGGIFTKILRKGIIRACEMRRKGLL